MKKTRIYELAKELNTSSKRLLEKLAEINISVKNHMSFLDENQLNALYDHIGVIRHNDSSTEAEGKSPKPPKASMKTESIKETSDIPTIIRKTVIDSEDDNRRDRFGENVRKDNKPNESKRRRRRDFVKVADESTGLRPGLTRTTGFDYVNELLNEKKAKRKKEEQAINLKEKKEKGNVIIAAEDERDIIEPAVEKDKKSTEKPEAEVTTKKLEKDISEKSEKIAAEKKAQEAKKEDVLVQDSAAEARKKIDKQALKGEHYGDIEKETTEIDSESLKQKLDKNKEAAERKAKSEGKVVPDRKSDKNDKVRLSGKAAKGKERKDEVAKTKSELKKGTSATEYHGASELVQPPITNILDTADVSKSKPRVIKKEYENKYHGKAEKKESKKEIIKPSGRKKKISPESLVIGEKKKISEALTDGYMLDLLDETPFSKKRVSKPKKDSKKAATKAKHIPKKAVLTSITIPETISVKDLAEALKKTSSEVIKTLMGFGVMATLNQEIDFDTATIVADEFGVKTEKEVTINEEDILFDESEEKESDLMPRPPVVVVMGHVDHGKTSLLDAIRKTNVTVTEQGGITQHIGAYMVDVDGRKITFLDTPGHEAFTSMRARGAQVTDIAVLVVSADDGIMPQTVEAINHAKAAKVSIIVAINKIDKPGANPDRVKQQLTEYGLLPEEWGGDTICVNVSAINGTNIDELLEMILLSADLLELKANPKKQAKGTVIEAQLDRNRGAVATLLVQRGTLRNGDTLIAGTAVGNIRAMVNDKGQRIESASPSTPVEVLGLDEVPKAGEIFYAVTDEKLARQLAEKRKQSIRDDMIKTKTKITLEDLFSQIQAGNVKELNIIVKADVQGSVEAVRQSLEKLSNDEVRINTVHGGVGAINESDVKLAEVTNAIIIGFNVRPSSNVIEIAKSAGVDMRMYRVIYDAIEDIQMAMKGMLDPTFREVIIGHAEVRQIFRASGVGTIGGCYVTDGKIQRNCEVRVVRDGVVVHEGKLSSLKRFKDDVREVAQGFECGLMVERFNDIKENDVIECYIMEEVRE